MAHHAKHHTESQNLRQAYDPDSIRGATFLERMSSRIRAVDKTKDHSWWLRWFKPTYDSPSGVGRVRALALFLGYGGAALMLRGMTGFSPRMFILGLIMTGCGVLLRSLDL